MPAEFASDVPSMPVAGRPEKGMGRREVRVLGVVSLEFVTRMRMKWFLFQEIGRKESSVAPKLS